MRALTISKYVGRSIEKKPTLRKGDRGVLFYEEDTKKEFVWTGLKWNAFGLEIGTITTTPLTYDYVKVYDILNIPEEPTWTPVASLTAATTIGSVYEYKMSIQGGMADLNDYASIRFRIDGGAWSTYRKEAKDNDDTFGFSYLFPLVATGIETTFELQAAKEVGGRQFDILFADLIIQQVKI